MAHHILIVDDNRIMRSMVERTVMMSGLEVASVRQAADGALALVELRRQTADLVLLDINMPTMSGEALLAEMRMDDALSAIPVVVVSSDASEARRRRLRYLGAEFVGKPFKPEELVAAVQRLLQARNAGAMP